MEALEDSNCPSMSDSFCIYERYVRSFDVVDSFRDKSRLESADDVTHRCRQDTGNVLHRMRDNEEVITNTDSHYPLFDAPATSRVNSAELCRPTSPFNPDSSLHSSTTADSNQTEKSDPLPLTSEDSKSEHSKFPKPVIITSSITMENSNNAVDSGPLFCNKTDSVFKLPISELSFNGTLKHVKRLKPIVDPMSALNSASHIEDGYNAYLDAKLGEDVGTQQNVEKTLDEINSCSNSFSSENKTVNGSQPGDMASNSTGDSQYEEFFSLKDRQLPSEQEKTLENSYSSLEGSFDSGVRSPDMFSDDDDDDDVPKHGDFWDFLNEFEVDDKIKIRKMEDILQGIPPPPSVTMLKTNVTEMLKKYYSFLPMFNEDANIIAPATNAVTPTKLTSFVKIPENTQPHEILEETTDTSKEVPPKITCIDISNEHVTKENIINEIVSTAIISQSNRIAIDLDRKSPDKEPNGDISSYNNDIKNISKTLEVVTSNFKNKVDNNTNNFEMDDTECGKSGMHISTSVKDDESDNSELNLNCNELIDKQNVKFTHSLEAANTPWPDVLKCKYNDVYYNITKYSERIELLALRYSERYIGAETNSSVTVHSGDMQSPSSACKRKALRLKMAQAKSPGRRLSHLARRRQAFCSAATFGDKAHASTAKMVLIDKKKLINTGKSPRLRRTPGKRTPGRKTPAKKTPAKTPKTRSGGGSSRKKVVRRLITDNGTRTLPTRETSKRALFISPENRKCIPQVASTSVPVQAMKSKRALFPSPDRMAETKSSDGCLADQFLRRKRSFDDVDGESRSKIAKSLSFGGDSIAHGQAAQPLARRASEMFSSRNMANLDENQRKKLLWAVSEALRIHGWRMQSPGFREKAGALARLTRRLLTLPYHNARMNAPKLSTSETFLKMARQYVFAIIKGKSIEECFQEEQERLAKDANHKVTGYISASNYQQLKVRQTPSLLSSKIKENSCDGVKQELQRSGSKNVLQDKLLNVDNNSNSNSSSLGLSSLDRSGIYKSNSMPSFEEAAKMRARRQISFDNVDFPKR